MMSVKENLIGRKVFGRDGTYAKKPGVIRGVRMCQLEGCGASQVNVVWPDGKRTWPCLDGMNERSDGSFQIR